MVDRVTGFLDGLDDMLPNAVWALIDPVAGVVVFTIAWQAFVARSLVAPFIGAVGFYLFCMAFVRLRRKFGSSAPS
jgi:hypothetical protein